MRYNTTSSTSATTNQIASCLPTRHSFPMMLTPRFPPHTPSAYRCPRRARRSRAAASTCCACHAQMPCDPDVGTTPCSARHQAHSITSDPIPSSTTTSAGQAVPVSSFSPTITSSGRCRPHHPHIDRPHFLTPIATTLPQPLHDLPETSVSPPTAESRRGNGTHH